MYITYSWPESAARLHQLLERDLKGALVWGRNIIAINKITSVLPRMKREARISGNGGMSFIYQHRCEKSKLLFLNMLHVCGIFQLPRGSGPQYKSMPNCQLLCRLLVPSPAL